MYRRLLDRCRCPACGAELQLVTLATEPGSDEIREGLLSCPDGHWFPVVRGVPRLMPDALAYHWAQLEQPVAEAAPELLDRLQGSIRSPGAPRSDTRTQAHFDNEWDQHEVGSRTWGMDLRERIQTYFLDPLRLPVDELAAKVVLDAGCGDGSQSVAYTEFGLEVIAVDISTSVDKGHSYRALHPGAEPEKVHFVQADLQRPALAPASVDIIHSVGTLYHTPDTRETFRVLRSLLRPGGTFYMSLFKYEPYVTPFVNGIRAVTTKVPADRFAKISRSSTVPFLALRRAMTALRFREYPRMSRAEGAVALMDLLGPPYAHYHSPAEVEGWYRDEGFGEVWVSNESRRSFGICGRLPAEPPTPRALEALPTGGGKAR